MYKFIFLTIIVLSFVNLSASQNVGIGTNNPEAKLHINSIETGHVLKLQGINPYLSFYDEAENYRGYLWGLYGSLNLGTPTNDVRITPAYNIVATFKPDGKVGIGQINPNQTMDINGKLKVGDDSTPPTAGTIRFNQISQDFEGFNGSVWLSLTNGLGGGNNWPGPNNGTISNYCQLRPNDSNEADYFGQAVELYGEFAFISSPNKEMGEGAVYVYKRNGNNWMEVQKLLPLESGEIASFGSSISCDGTFLAIGANSDPIPPGTAHGSVTIYTFDGTNWVFHQKIIPSTTTSTFGSAVKVKDNQLLVSAAASDSVFLYKYLSGAFSLSQNFSTIDAWTFGSELDLTSNYMVIQKLNDPPSFDYELFIYKKIGANFVIEDTLTHASSSWGKSPKFFNEDYIFVGDPSLNKVSVYTKDASSNWVEQQSFVAPFTEANQLFGTHIEIDGEFIYVTAESKDVSDGCSGSTVADKGEVYIFQFKNNMITYIDRINDHQGQSNTGFGTSCSVHNNHFVIGAGLSDVPFINVGKAIFGKKN